jgi:rhodanese-related sulfurtransferase
MPATIHPAEIARRRAAGEPFRLIDVRTPLEFHEVHAAGAENVPLDRLQPAQLQSATDAAPLYVICRSGRRAAEACERLHAAGLNVVSVEGGTLAWEAAGLPVERSDIKIMSLERQVRIAAGLMVLASVLLGALVHAAFYGLAALVGTGLVFAGITDWCGMGMLLARMPWNQVGSYCASQSCASH